MNTQNIIDPYGFAMETFNKKIEKININMIKAEKMAKEFEEILDNFFLHFKNINKK